MAQHTDEQRIKAANLRYEEAMHAVQTGVLETMRRKLGQATLRAADVRNDLGEASPKHLRVGISSAMVNDKAIASILIAKGIITEVEYMEAIAKAAEEERDLYEQFLGVKLG